MKQWIVFLGTFRQIIVAADNLEQLHDMIEAARDEWPKIQIGPECTVYNFIPTKEYLAQ